jgi:hypothetical protein
MSADEKTVDSKLLERRANVVRSRLLRTIDALDSRRHHVEAIGAHAKRLAVPVAASFAGVVVLTVGVVLGIRSLVQHRGRTPMKNALARLDRWRAPRRPSLFEEVGRKALTAVVTIIATEVARRTLKNVFDGRIGGEQGARP